MPFLVKTSFQARIGTFCPFFLAPPWHRRGTDANKRCQILYISASQYIGKTFLEHTEETLTER
jgi:hypothetical protein